MNLQGKEYKPFKGAFNDSSYESKIKGRRGASPIPHRRNKVVSIEEVMELIRGAGMNAYYVGDLDIAITIEGLTAVLVYLNKYNDIKHASIKIVGS